jgi:hypothetical protein
MSPPPSGSKLEGWALKAVKALEFLPGFPRTEDGMRAYTLQVQSMCGGRLIAEKLIGCVAAGAERFPTPIELRRILSARICEPADGVKSREADLADLMGRER